MKIYRHYVIGFFSARSSAEKLFSQLISQAVSHKFIRIFDKYSILPTSLIKENGLEGEGNLFAGGAADSLSGTGLSSLVGVHLDATDVTLIAEESLVPQLVSLGWGESLGVINKSFYTRGEQRMLSDLVHDAILSRQIVLVVETSSYEETYRVSDLIHATLGNLSDVI
ncbi:hypothetical protein GCM10011613_16070 [Cellvibrio zantedeschiae]|uniref:Nucleoside 2-deoxyribosyltransferase n=1 Tax=Cellvibrio zantedeschiae TaxID=1237077 RepID=A0ABQ3AYQ6_9GAMM|nr:hypothetical protein [Cellvibrio zantedeschiae]GGY71946.1 hypothetical protein GCM10011613_16070 [Cellvibrio zantedeschiae]